MHVAVSHLLITYRGDSSLPHEEFQDPYYAVKVAMPFSSHPDYRLGFEVRCTWHRHSDRADIRRRPFLRSLTLALINLRSHLALLATIPGPEVAARLFFRIQALCVRMFCHGHKPW